MKYTEDIKVARPIFLKQRDVRDILSSRSAKIDLISSMEAVIPNRVQSVQGIGGLWYLYTKDETSRIKLLINGLDICGHHINPYESNPFTAGDVLSERILFRDLPLTVMNGGIRDFLANHPQVNMLTDVMYDMIRDKYNIATQYYSGDRYVIARDGICPLFHKTAVIDGVTCKIWHRSQALFCQRCRGTDHKTSQTSLCDFYTENPQVIVFKSPAHPLSNFHRCQVTMDGCQYDSAEHAYQFLKLRYLEKNDLADCVLRASSPAEAKKIAARIEEPDKQRWNQVKCEAMFKVLKSKAESYHPFVRTLMESGDCILAECTSDIFWGTGLSPNLTKTTKPELYQDRNMLGRLLQELRALLFQHKQIDENKKNEEQQDAATESMSTISADKNIPHQGTTKTHPETEESIASTIRDGFAAAEASKTVNDEDPHHVVPDSATSVMNPDLSHVNNVTSRVDDPI